MLPRVLRTRTNQKQKKIKNNYYKTPSEFRPIPKQTAPEKPP
jgi:hypothetical protein